MRRRSTWVRGTFAVLLLGSAMVAASCQPPTQVYIVLRTDMVCGAPQSEGYGIQEIHLYAGSSRASVTERIGIRTDAILERCKSSGGLSELGRLVVHPDSSDSAYVQVVASLTRTKPGGGTETRAAEACRFDDPNNRNCLMAMRSFKYTQNATGFVPITLSASCIPKWFTCPSGQTCIDGECVSDSVTPTPELEPWLPAGKDASIADASSSDAKTDASDASADAGPADASPDANTEAGTPIVPIQLALGNDHTCALYSHGRVACWGGNTAGQLGYGNVTNVGTDTGGFVIVDLPNSFAGYVLVGTSVSGFPIFSNMLNLTPGVWHHISMTFAPSLVQAGNGSKVVFEQWSGSPNPAGNAYFDNIQVSTTPEPGSMLLAGAGILLVLVGRARVRA